MPSDPRVAIVSAMRDEGPNIVDWVAHARAAGANDVLVLSNDCTDGSDALLGRLAEGGALCHVRNDVPDGRAPQWSALRIAADHPALRAADWIAHLDCDEYVNLRAPLTTLQDLIAACPEGTDAIALPWRLFGSAGHAGRPNAPTPAAFTAAIRPGALYPASARFVKTIYRRVGPFGRPGVHRPRQRVGAAPNWVDGSGVPLPADFAQDAARIILWREDPGSDLVQLNHYPLRSAEDYMAKRRRGLPNHTDKPLGIAYWAERNFNETADDSIVRMAPAKDVEAARLRALPGVAAAEAACLAHHQAAFAGMLRDPAETQLFGRLLMTHSRSPDPAMARRLIALYQQAQRALATGRPPS